MVSLKYNEKWWGRDYPWDEAGDEWSEPWGGSSAQWYGSILPRIHSYLPASEVLEIACGFGRWTQFLKEECDRLTAVDLAENCIAACEERFAGDEGLRFIANDGMTLPGVSDSSIDFAFSFDSLVHVDQATIVAYLAELSRVLKADGVAFIHHSNLGAYAGRYRWVSRIPKLGGLLRRLGVVEYSHMRDPTVTAEFVAKEASRLGLCCIHQELTPWLTRRTFIDCTSVIVRASSGAARSNRVLRNRHFSREPAYTASVASLYGSRPER